MLTADNTDLYFWPVDEDIGGTVTTGLIVQTLEGGHQLSDPKLVIKPPSRPPYVSGRVKRGSGMSGGGVQHRSAIALGARHKNDRGSPPSRGRVVCEGVAEHSYFALSGTRGVSQDSIRGPHRHQRELQKRALPQTVV